MISGCRFGKLTAKPELNCGALDLRRSFLWLGCWKVNPLDFRILKEIKFVKVSLYVSRNCSKIRLID